MANRECLACNRPLERIEMQGQTVDRCNGCEGIFFDQGELESVIHLVNLFQSVTIDEEDIDSVPQKEHERIVYCPEDRTEMNPKDIMGLTIDICPKCNGIWLDRGEIAILKLAENHIRQNLSLYIRLGE
jgi:Zn-finger nucleic acid-binding protein